MKLTADLSLKQSLSLTTDMRLAIDMLSMSSMEILELLDRELAQNAALEEFDDRPKVGLKDSAFEIAEKTQAASPDFRTELWQQAKLHNFNYFELNIAYFLIHSLDERGLLPDKAEVYAEIIKELHVFAEWIDSVRFRLMDFEPLGCGAVDALEYLLIHLHQRSAFSHDELVTLLNKKKISKSDMAKLQTDPHLADLKNLLPAIKSFDERANAIFIDIIVEKSAEGLRITLLKRARDQFFVRPKAMALKDQHRRAHFLLKALRFREDNLLKVATVIIMHQQEWFLGRGPLRPLGLREVALALGLHESSISRLSRNKYLSCDLGTFELSYFFNQKALINDQGDECSAFAIKDKIRLLIQNENKRKPLSDQQIHKALLLADMPIARRTVAKYRESLHLPIAKERRISF